MIYNKAEITSLNEKEGLLNLEPSFASRSVCFDRRIENELRAIAGRRPERETFALQPDRAESERPVAMYFHGVAVFQHVERGPKERELLAPLAADQNKWFRRIVEFCLRRALRYRTVSVFLSR
jgi:hypothetical protein